MTSKVDMDRMEAALSKLEQMQKLSGDKEAKASTAAFEVQAKRPEPQENKVPEITVIVPPHDKTLVITVRESMSG